MWLTVAQIALTLIAVLVCHNLGIRAMVMAFAAINVLWLLAWQWFANRQIGYRFMNMLRDLLPFMGIALIVVGATYLLTCSLSNLYVLLITRVLIAVALYLLIMKLLHARIMEECIEFLLSRYNKNKIQSS